MMIIFAFKKMKFDCLQKNNKIVLLKSHKTIDNSIKKIKFLVVEFDKHVQ